jgi:TonB family protein
MQEYIVSNPLFNSLALTLIHFIWQGCFIALALKFSLILTSQKNPQLRYAFSSIAMLSCLLLPFITFGLIYQSGNTSLPFSSSIIPTLYSAATNLTLNSFYWPTNVIELLPYLSVIWLAIVMLLTTKLLVEVFMVNQLTKQSVVPANAKLSARFIELVEKMRLTVTPRLLISLQTDVPMAIGWLKPVILLPASMLSGLSSSQLEMLLLHELAHIRRHDYLVNFIQTLVALLLFFHPAVQWISKQMRNEREYCSDDIAVQYCGDAIAYAHTLADTAAICSKHRHHTIPKMAMAASGGDLKQRVVRLVDHHCTSSNDAGKWMAATAIIIGVLVFSAQQFLSPSIFEIGVTNQNQEALISTTNYQQISLAQTSIATQLLTSRANSLDSISTIDIQVINHRLLLANTLTKKLNLENEAPRLKIDNNEQPIADTSRNAEKLTALINTDTETKAFVDDSLAVNKSITVVTGVLDAQKTKPNKDSSIPSNVATDQLMQVNNSTVNKLNSLDNTEVESKLSMLDKRQLNSSVNEQFSPKKSNTQLSLLRKNKQETYNITNTEGNVELLPLQEAAELISAIDPKYPSSAKRKGLELEVHVHFTIDEAGLIKNLEFEQQHKISYFRNAIKTAMRKWAFHPAKIDGQPVESKMSKIFSFSLTG